MYKNTSKYTHVGDYAAAVAVAVAVAVDVPDIDKRQTDGVAVLDGVLVPVPEAPLDREAVIEAVDVRVGEAV
jgi:hypothetical protein